jgi:glycosyltransferase involved in cell wall biosynthesis
LNVDDAIVMVPFLERDELAAIYRRAAVLLQTSESEGFGLPLIEALACGCPVIASDIPVLREVGGQAAEYCVVGHVESWKESVVRLLRSRTQPDREWDLRRRHGLDRAEQFSWAENARQTERIYRQVLDAAALGTPAAMHR